MSGPDEAAHNYIWITRWRDFQHYAPNRDRGPAWIKQHTAQLDDERYLSLSSKDRSVLHDLRMVFATMRQRVPNHTRMLSQLCGQRVTNVTLQRLNHAGLIEFLSREALDHALENLYSRSRSRSRERNPQAVTSTTDAGSNGRQIDLDIDFDNILKTIPD